jgi:hypothetical protein
MGTREVVFDGVSTSGTRQGSKYTWFFGINLMNLDNIVIEKVVVVNTPAYHIHFSNVGHVSVSGLRFKKPGIEHGWAAFRWTFERHQDLGLRFCDRR